jgi:hypothetical protein
MKLTKEYLENEVARIKAPLDDAATCYAGSGLPWARMLRSDLKAVKSSIQVLLDLIPEGA